MRTTSHDLEILKDRYRHDQTVPTAARRQFLNGFFYIGMARAFSYVAAAGITGGLAYTYNYYADVAHDLKAELGSPDSAYIDNVGGLRTTFIEHANFLFMNADAKKHEALTYAAVQQTAQKLKAYSGVHIEYPDQGNTVLAIPTFGGALTKPTKVHLDPEELGSRYRARLKNAHDFIEFNRVAIPTSWLVLEAGIGLGLFGLRRQRQKKIDFLKLKYGGPAAEAG